MKAQEMVGLTSSAFKEYEEKYANIKEMRDVFSKQLALEAKIKKVEVRNRLCVIYEDLVMIIYD